MRISKPRFPRHCLGNSRRHKHPEPKFTVNGFFTATFWPTREGVHKVVGEVLEEVEGKLGSSGEQVSEQVDEQSGPAVLSCPF